MNLSAQQSSEDRNMKDIQLCPEYRIFSVSSGEPLNTVETHVLARAYRATWRSLFANDPLGPHVIAALDVVFVFSVEGVEGES